MSSSSTDLPPEASEHLPRENMRAARYRWLFLVLLLLGAGIALGIGIGSRFQAARAIAEHSTECAPLGQQADAPASLAAPIQPEPAPAVGATPCEKPAAIERAASAPDPHLAMATPATPKRQSASPKGRPVGRRAPPLAPDLHEALQLLAAAQQALKAADATLALSLLEKMERRTPDALVEEREVTRALAHCAAHDVESARRSAALLRKSGAARVYAHRLSESCVGPPPAPASLLEEMRQRALQ